MEEFRQAQSTLPDPRRAQGRRYPFFSVVTIALMAMVSGWDDAEAFDAWGEHHEEWLSQMLPLPLGTPSQDVYLAVFAALDSRAFNGVFAAWVELLKARLSLQGKRIKTINRPCMQTSARPLRMRSTRVLAPRSKSTNIGSDAAASAQEHARLIRAHWGIENSLHWVLDMAFREDEARHRAGNLSANFATLRHFAFNVVKHSPGRKLSVANTRKIISWDLNKLVEVISGSHL